MENHPEWYVLIMKDDDETPKRYGSGWRFFRVYNRFDKPYVKRVLRRFRLLEYLSENHHFVHVVLTVNRNVSRVDAFRLLTKNWNRLRSLLIKRIGFFKFLRVLEAHRDGYPHMHLLIFTKRYVIKQMELSRYCREYGLGKIVFIKRYWAGRYHKRLPVAYLSKYLTKQFKREWRDGDWIFYALLWKFRFRSYGFSNGFCSMKPERSLSLKWVKVAVCDYEGIIKLVNTFIKLGLWCDEGCIDEWLDRLK